VTVTRRGRVVAITLAIVAGLGVAVLIAGPHVDKAVQEVTLPLRHEDIIRQQASDKELDPALVAAVIYAESRFNARESSAGAQGLMQITPATARYIARKSGGTSFETNDLDTPQINISYGSFYLRYLLDRYGGNETLALAAHNGGEGNVDRWIVDARKREDDLDVHDIPFPETRAYVDRVLDARSDYKRTYRDELGL
jgi:soluble lytic murein transglycosylase